jgi:hypothetical protein
LATFTKRDGSAMRLQKMLGPLAARQTPKKETDYDY